MGAGHYIRNTGSGTLRLLIGFNNGHYHSHDLNAWLASNPPDVLATNLDLPPNGRGSASEGDTLYRTTPSLVLVARSGGIASMLGRSAS
jgi:hypothetical protein